MVADSCRGRLGGLEVSVRALLPVVMAWVVGCGGSAGKGSEPAGADEPQDSDSGIAGDVDADGDGMIAGALTDCDDADPTVFVGAYERCDALDEDCDGVADERCVRAADAVVWEPVWVGTPAQVDRYCSPPFALVDDDENSGEASCPGGGPATLQVGSPDLDGVAWYSLLANPDLATANLTFVEAAAGPLSGDFLLEATVEVLEGTSNEACAGDESAGALIALSFEGEGWSATGGYSGASYVYFPPDGALTSRWRGLGSMGEGLRRLPEGTPTRVQLVRVDNHLELWQDGEHLHTRTLPGVDPLGDLAPAEVPALESVALACANCEARFTDVALFAARSSLTEEAPEACPNRLRNPGFEDVRDDLPDWWGVQTPRVRSDAQTSLTGSETRAALEAVVSGEPLSGEAAVELTGPPDGDLAGTALLQPTLREHGEEVVSASFTAELREPSPDGQARLRVRLGPPVPSTLKEGYLAATLVDPCAEDLDTADPCFAELELDEEELSTARDYELSATGCEEDGVGDELRLCFQVMPPESGLVGGEATVAIDEVSLTSGTAADSCAPWEDDMGTDPPESLDLRAPLVLWEAQDPVDLDQDAAEWGSESRRPLLATDGTELGEVAARHDADTLYLMASLEDCRAEDTLELRLDPAGEAYAPVRLRTTGEGLLLDHHGLARAPETAGACELDGEAGQVELALPLADLGLTPAAAETWSVQLIRWGADPARTASLAPRLAGPEGAATGAIGLVWMDRIWRTGLAEELSWTDTEPPAWSVVDGRPMVHIQGHAQDAGNTGEWEGFADLGLPTLVAANPYTGHLEGFADNAEGLVEIEVYTTQLWAVWDDATVGHLGEVDASITAAEEHSPGVLSRWSLVDEPLDQPARMAACAAEQGSECDDLRCWRDWPELLQSHVEALPNTTGVPLGVNLTFTEVAAWSDELEGTGIDFVSWTDNWVHEHPLHRWRLGTGESLAEDAPGLVRIGMGQISGTTQDYRWRRAPDPVELRGHGWLHLVEGARGLRWFDWPPRGPVPLGAMVELMEELEVFDGRVVRDPAPITSSPDVRARVFGTAGLPDDQFLAVVNRSHRTVHARISLDGLDGHLCGWDAPGEGAQTAEGDALDLALAPREARVFQVSETPCAEEVLAARHPQTGGSDED